MEAALNVLLEQGGIFAAIAVVLGYAYWKERGDNNGLRDRRVEDVVSDRDSYRDALQDSTKAMETLTKLIDVRINGGQ